MFLTSRLLRSLLKQPGFNQPLTVNFLLPLYPIYGYTNSETLYYHVHEFREPGHGMEISNDITTPYYYGMTDLQGRETWELVYPIGFFKDISNRSLDSLKDYLHNNDLDPYSCYEFGSIWKCR
jgi:hypothetical protein